MNGRRARRRRDDRARASDRVRPFDRVHEAATEAACDLDRAWFERHPASVTYVRPALEHEVCVPGEACRRLERVQVWQLEPGIRARCAL